MNVDLGQMFAFYLTVGAGLVVGATMFFYIFPGWFINLTLTVGIAFFVAGLITYEIYTKDKQPGVV